MFSPMSADPLWSDTDKVEVLNPNNTASSEISELPGLIDPRSDIAATVGVEGACRSLHAPSTIASLQSTNPTNTAEDENLDAKIVPASELSLTSSGAPHVWTVGSSNTHAPTTVCFENNVEPVCSFPRVLRLHSDMLFGTTSANEAKVNSEDPIPENVQPTDCPLVSSNCVSSTPTENLSRTSRRKSVLKPLQAGQRRSRSTSFSSASDLEPLSGSSQDSELSYLPFILKQGPGPSNRMHGPVNRISLCSTSSRSCGSLSTNGSLFESTGDKSVFDREESGTPSPYQHGGSMSSDFIVSQRSLSRRGDYVQRDIAALEHAHVPFSYEEIVGASNEKFREMKSTPYLTPHQMDVLITARKRATNRQAAERCRRLKLATRDDLSEQLAALRTERQVLVRQIAQARQRKQRASDALLAEQKRVLSLLCGPEGDRLKYSDWRVRLTHDDEVVVVAVGR
ncbi:nuclear factor erythroid 2-related factor 3 [Clonorchis sinensis]|uniref:Nuclear factor erythroid 2-related factor 3 n=1 Tax=Clonorchis sinensis TaxID=79923 RepID=G7YBX4_CLOSI|nr:nuclear factor erythroid 2-related factor 3 [Clonorchis sinensis]